MFTLLHSKKSSVNTFAIFHVLLLKLKKIIGKNKVPMDSAEVGAHMNLKGQRSMILSLFNITNNAFPRCIQKLAEEGESANTTLQAYFFGKKGENKLQYQEFCR